MKTPGLLVLCGIAIIIGKTTFSQNVALNIVTHQSGIVKQGATLFLEVSVVNTSAVNGTVAYFKLKPQISVPAFVRIDSVGHQLPPGWSIIYNDGTTIRLTNGIDSLPPNVGRNILLALTGIAPGGPSTIGANLFFSNGMEPGTVAGSPTRGDNTNDNFSTTAITVLRK